MYLHIYYSPMKTVWQAAREPGYMQGQFIRKTNNSGNFKIIFAPAYFS